MPATLLACAGAGVANSGGVAPSSLLTGLAAYWKLDEASGSRVDSVGGMTLTDHNTVTSTTGKQGQAAQFTAANLEYLSHADDPVLSMGVGARMTLAGWFFPSSGAATLVGKWGGVGNYEYLIYRFAGDTVTAYVTADGTNTVGAGNLNPGGGTWHFFALRYDGVNLGLRIDAQPWQNTAFSADIFNGTSPFEIGRQTTASPDYLNGLADELGLWKVALSDPQVESLYNSYNGVTYPFTGVP